MRLLWLLGDFIYGGLRGSDALRSWGQSLWCSMGCTLSNSMYGHGLKEWLDEENLYEALWGDGVTMMMMIPWWLHLGMGWAETQPLFTHGSWLIFDHGQHMDTWREVFSWDTWHLMEKCSLRALGWLEGWHIADVMEVASWTWMWQTESWRLMRWSLHMEEAHLWMMLGLMWLISYSTLVPNIMGMLQMGWGLLHGPEHGLLMRMDSWSSSGMWQGCFEEQLMVAWGCAFSWFERMVGLATQLVQTWGLACTEMCWHCVGVSWQQFTWERYMMRTTWYVAISM